MTWFLAGLAYGAIGGSATGLMIGGALADGTLPPRKSWSRDVACILLLVFCWPFWLPAYAAKAVAAYRST